MNTHDDDFQGNARRVLFVCSEGRCRSPTAAQWAATALGWNTRSCGLNVTPAIPPIHSNLVVWAETIYCMEDRHRDELVLRFPGTPFEKLEVLHVLDHFEYNSEELIALLEEIFNHRGEKVFAATRNLADDNIRLRRTIQMAWPYVSEHCTIDSLRAEIIQEMSARAIVQTGLSIPSYEVCASKRENQEPMSMLEKFIFDNEPAGIDDDVRFRSGLLCVIREIMRLNPIPSAWMRSMRTHDTPDSPAEWVEEVVPGEDRPMGEKWLPLFAQRQV